jgi:hypothetical protein
MIRIGILWVMLMTLFSCEKKMPEKTAESAPQSSSEQAAAIVSTNKDDWKEADLKAVVPVVHLRCAVPKGATLSENGNGGVDISIGENYLIHVYGPLYTESLNESMNVNKEGIRNDQISIFEKFLKEESQGYIYTTHLKTEENGKTYPTAAHFKYWIKTSNGNIFSIEDAVPISKIGEIEDRFTPEVATAVYTIIKNSVKEN